jgi:hypothetical protein
MTKPQVKPYKCQHKRCKEHIGIKRHQLKQQRNRCQGHHWPKDPPNPALRMGERGSAPLPFGNYLGIKRCASNHRSLTTRLSDARLRWMELPHQTGQAAGW